MALLQSTYKPPLLLFNGHMQTIYPALFRKAPDHRCRRYTIETADGDFLVVDHHVGSGRRRAAILCHGLEGHSRKPYMLGMARWYNKHGWDVYAWNYRGCAGRPNRLRRFYHSGATEDLDTVVRHVEKQGFNYISLIGFSLGGNLLLKYLGEQERVIPVGSAVAFSVPLDLHAGVLHLNRPQNRIYQQRFLISLKKKIREKHRRFADIEIEQLGRVKTLMEFDDLYTAPIHGFADARDYYRQCSALYFLDSIRIPALIVNAQNDPFLTPESMPYRRLEKHPYVHLETPGHGGHTGFAQMSLRNVYWSERRAVFFSERHL